MSQMTIPGASPISRQRDASGRFTAKSASAGAGAVSSGRVVERSGFGQGVYTGLLGAHVPRIQDPQLYEDLREALPMLDSAISAHVYIDGFVAVEAESDQIQRAWDEWSQKVEVGDLGLGYQLAVDQLLGETYEQGFGVMEVVGSAALRDVTGLNVADSKRIWFERAADTTLGVYYQQTLRTRRNLGAPHEQFRRVIQPAWGLTQYVGFSRTDAVDLDRSSLVALRNRPENNSPWGVSVIRSVPFVAKILATILNSVLSVRERFGDPVYFARYKSGGKKSEADLTKINDRLAAAIKTAVASKRAGRSADIVQSVGKDDDLEIKVLGADNQVIDVRTDGDFIVAQVASATQMPLTLLGIPTANNESAGISAALFASKKRFETYRPMLSRPIETMLRLRGIKAPVGSWRLVQNQPNYDDILKRAQAHFMYAQGRAIYGVTFPDGPKMIEVSTGGAIQQPTSIPAKKLGAAKSAKAPRRSAPDPAAIAETFGGILADGWDDLLADVAAYLVTGVRSTKAPRQLDDETYAYLLTLAEAWGAKMVPYGELAAEKAIAAGAAIAATATGFGAPVMVGTVEAGLVQAGLGAIGESVPAAAYDLLKTHLAPVFENFSLTGQNPQDLARLLHREFGDLATDRLHRLARTEVAGIVESGKKGEWKAEGVAYLTTQISNPSCPVCGPTMGVYPIDAAPKYPWDTHPNCVCTTRPSTRSERDGAGYTDPPIDPNPNRDLLPEDLR